ncbi:hypothetical protein [Pseudogemmobacter sonorensis]|uniref:hypothetical protein n=1 Tax=Pseudogemmobacter sonorensis TaxID=2989681 RepID=UPI0036B7D435
MTIDKEEVARLAAWSRDRSAYSGTKFEKIADTLTAQQAEIERLRADRDQWRAAYERASREIIECAGNHGAAEARVAELEAERDDAVRLFHAADKRLRASHNPPESEPQVSDAELDALAERLSRAAKMMRTHKAASLEASDLDAAARALRARKPAEVKVKPLTEKELVWVDQPNYSSALTTDGLFYIADATGWRCCIVDAVGRYIRGFGEWHGCGSLEAAKAAAQSDHESRIRAALIGEGKG